MRWAFAASAILLLAVTLISAAMANQPGLSAQATRFDREPNLDRSGSDIASEHLAPEATIDSCEDRCLQTPGCVAYTFVKRSATVAQPICWLKNIVPTGYPSECCTSGILRR